MKTSPWPACASSFRSWSHCSLTSSVSSRRQLQSSEYSRKAGWSCAQTVPHDRCDAGNIGAVALQQLSVTVTASFVKAAAVDLIRLDCADYETRRTDTRLWCLIWGILIAAREICVLVNTLKLKKNLVWQIVFRTQASALALKGVALAWPWGCVYGLGLECSGLGLGLLLSGLVNIPANVKLLHFA